MSFLCVFWFTFTSTFTFTSIYVNMIYICIVFRFAYTCTIALSNYITCCSFTLHTISTHHRTKKLQCKILRLKEKHVQVHFPLLPSWKLLPRTISPMDFVIRQQSNVVNWQLLLQLESPPKPTISHLKLFFHQNFLHPVGRGKWTPPQHNFFFSRFWRKTSSTELKTLRSMVPSISWRRAVKLKLKPRVAMHQSFGKLKKNGVRC